MARKAPSRKRSQSATGRTPAASVARPSPLVDTRIISACACSHADRYCGDCLDQLRKLPDGCVDRSYLWHRFPTGDSNSNRNYEVFWGERSEPRTQVRGPLPAFEDGHAGTQAYIAYVRPRYVELSRVLKKTGSFYYHCDGQRTARPPRPTQYWS
jgi:hypothetical protein